VNARSLKHRVSIQRPPTDQDEAGQPTGGWTTFATVWADIRQASGLETIKADAPTSQVKASIRIRRRTDVTAAMRVVHGSTTYEIKAVLDDLADRRHVDLACEVVS
jgi:SPP1 family predicted phage head-tail adaptor